MALKWFLLMPVIVALIFFSINYLHSKPLALSLLSLIILPFVFIKSLMNYFTRKVTIQVEDDEIFFNIQKKRNEKEDQNQSYKLHDIKSYQIQFPTYRFACIILKLKAGNKKEYSLRTEKLADTQTDTDIIIETLHKTLDRHEIKFAPSFFASSKGLYAIVFLVVLLFIDLAIAIYLNKNPAPTLILVIMLIFQIVIRRTSDMAFYKKWNKT